MPGLQRCKCNCHAPMNYRFGDSKISHSDLDCIVLTSTDGSPFIVERAGQFLIIEAKRQQEELSLGQWILLKALARLPKFTVWILWDDGEERNPVELDIFRIQDDQCVLDEIKVTHASVQEKIDSWYWAVNQMW